MSPERLIEAELQASVVALDDVLEQRTLRCDHCRDTFNHLIGAAAGRVLFDHASGRQPDVALYDDFEGSRLQYWVTRSGRTYTILVFKFDYKNLPPPICLNPADIIYGPRRVIDVFWARRVRDTWEVNPIEDGHVTFADIRFGTARLSLGHELMRPPWQRKPSPTLH